MPSNVIKIAIVSFVFPSQDGFLPTTISPPEILSQVSVKQPNGYPKPSTTKGKENIYMQK
jgi:hypothetical protein